ncbi:MAG: bifunctional DNA-formamidopyrimidine glycosylase/DNA-(apurinic or apyrimidinic site) lyase [Selenomonas sp.]|uniref:bifunctional DNA-formamidopyrimidine glycosylase/DNA-(apurinic or apyrimidinic site) lyase n=1 Tax=Selenomonas sp. TaxID=2053611 RepID=UPI0025D58EF7|nr:bifunctional DNA-formamidopyrimidine glycosylase/DNA-(apurinic or apyrimidinic site) lyase [Selenomonas sp.]MCR5757563.1 bifunctional DNA-formamidopyrimidine glycosylase/DNA-(apurinic or apyrimidinic site) lyase [Selenomonas sp.]
MPEMPEVEIIRRYIDKMVAGKQIMDIDIRLPRMIKWPDTEGFRALVTGRRIREMARRGKYLLMKLDNDNVVVFHLRMTGRLVYAPTGQVTDSYARVVFLLQDGASLIYGDTRTLGTIHGLKPQELGMLKGLAEMGPEPLSPEFTADYLYAAARKRKVAIKSFLLNQKYIGGIGNIYADEALFLAGVHPQRPANALRRDECERLWESINKVIAAGIADGGTTFRDYQNGEGGKGSHQEHLYVYNRNGEPCRVCESPIVRITVGGRGTHFCPKCQEMK